MQIQTCRDSEKRIRDSGVAAFKKFKNAYNLCSNVEFISYLQ